MRRVPPSAIALRPILRRMVLRAPLVLAHRPLRSIAPWRPARRTVVYVPTGASKPGAADSLHAPAARAVALLLPVRLLLLAVGLLLVARGRAGRIALHRAVLRKLPRPGRESLRCAVACFGIVKCGDWRE